MRLRPLNSLGDSFSQMQMKNKLLLACLIVLFGCDPLGRLVGVPKQEDTAVAPAPEYHEGSLNGTNFVEVSLDGAKEVSVYIKRGDSWIRLDAYDVSQKTKEPYYIASKNTVVFFNTVSTDNYSIKISY